MNGKISTRLLHSRWGEVITVGLLLFIIILLRVQHLEADPPPGLSSSSSIHTDPPLYTLFAKEYVKTGEFNPLHDQRVIVFIRTAITALAVVVFKLCGTGFWQNGLVGLIYSFGALLLFFFFIRKVGGSLTAVFYLIMIAVNYNQILLGRLPFMEQAMIFYSFLSLTLIVYGSGKVTYLLAGISLAVGIFFGKILGIIFVVPFGLYFSYLYLQSRKTADKIRYVYFAGGVCLVALIWLFFNYLSAQEQISSYFGDVFSMYGSPEGLRSFDDFIWKLISFGDSSKLIRRMPLAGILTAIFIGSMIIRTVSRKTENSSDKKEYAGFMFIAVTIVSFWLALMIWEYRPLRYQIVLIYPFYGAAAIVLASWWRKVSLFPTTKPRLAYYLLLLPVVWVTVYKIWAKVMNVINPDSYYEKDKYIIALLALLVTAVIGLAAGKHRRLATSWHKPALRLLVVVCIVTILGRGSLAYSFWWQRPTYSARDNCRDLSMILSPQAVLSGPFAAQLVMENDIGAVVHMFGTDIVDPELFRKYPVTHLVIDKANEERARRDYPKIMDNAVQVLTYHVAMKQIRVFRIAGYTGNPVANKYQPTIFEKAVDYYNNNQPETARDLLIRFLEEHPENMSGYQFVAEMSIRDGQIKLAEIAFKKAVEFSPTNYHLNLRVSDFYKDLFEASGEQRYAQESRKYFDLALKYAPTLAEIRESSQQGKSH